MEFPWKKYYFFKYKINGFILDAFTTKYKGLNHCSALESMFLIFSVSVYLYRQVP